MQNVIRFWRSGTTHSETSHPPRPSIISLKRPHETSPRPTQSSTKSKPSPTNNSMLRPTNSHTPSWKEELPKTHPSDCASNALHNSSSLSSPSSKLEPPTSLSIPHSPGRDWTGCSKIVEPPS